MYGFDRLSLEDLRNNSYCYLCGRLTKDTKQFRLIDRKSGAETDVKICSECLKKSDCK